MRAVSAIRIALLLCLFAGESALAQVGGIFKCTGTDGAVAYQGEPCSGRQLQAVLVPPRKVDPMPVDGAAAVDPSAAALNGDKRSVLDGAELQIGMSDTKVLNMRGWGRPRHIARNRAEAGWREEWTYVSRADGATRTVQFVNGKVAAIGEPQIVAASSSIDAQPLVRAAPSLSASDHAARPAESWMRAESPGLPSANEASPWREAPSHAATAAVAHDAYGAQAEKRPAPEPEMHASLPRTDASRRRASVAWSDSPASGRADAAPEGKVPPAAATPYASSAAHDMGVD